MGDKEIRDKEIGDKEMVDCHLDEGEVCFLGLGDWRPEIERKENGDWGKEMGDSVGMKSES